MQAREKISKSSWTLLEGIKDTLSSNLVTAIRSGQLKIEASQVERLLSVVAASSDEGHSKGHKTFMRVVDDALKDAASEASFDATMPTLAQTKQSNSKKK